MRLEKLRSLIFPCLVFMTTGCSIIGSQIGKPPDEKYVMVIPKNELKPYPNGGRYSACTINFLDSDTALYFESCVVKCSYSEGNTDCNAHIVSNTGVKIPMKDVKSMGVEMTRSEISITGLGVGLAIDITVLINLIIFKLL